MPISLEVSRSNPNRRRIGRYTSLFLAGATVLQSFFSGSIHAKTIESIQKPFEDTACSASTLLEGIHPQFEGQNGILTIRGYNTLSDPYNSVFRWAIDRSQNPEEASFDQSRWNMDVTALARLRDTQDGPPVFGMQLRMTTLTGTDIDQTIEATLPPSIEGATCTTGEYTLINGKPFMKINGIIIATDTEPIL